MSRLETDPPFPSPDPSAGHRHSISECPICGGGLCSVRAYLDAGGQLSHGLVICDECEAIWLQPNINGVHVYTDSEQPICPVSGQPLYGDSSRWATSEDLECLGWTEQIDPNLSYDPSSDNDG